MKKVLFVATVASHIKSFHLPYLKMLKEQGYKTYVAANWNLNENEEIEYCDEFIQIPIQRSPYSIKNLKAIKQLKNIINNEKFDIIHCHTPMGSVVTRMAAKNARKNGTRVIYTAHGFHFYKGAPIKNWLMFYPVEWYLAKYTDTLITINEEDFERAKRKFGKRCKDIQYVHGVGLDTTKFDFEMNEEEKLNYRNSLGLNKDDFIIIYPAEISKRKNQIWLIEGIKNLIYENKNIHLLLPGKDSLNGRCQSLVSKLNLDKQIHFLGYRKDIPQLLKISDMAISSSKQEGLPVNIMEAMYVGLPVVVTDCRGNRDLIENEYIVKNSDELTDKIIKLQNEKKYNRKNIEKYLLKNVETEMEKIYKRKKKILHVLASNKYSGAENVVCTIIKNMNDEFDMAYCSPNGSIAETLSERNIKYFPLKKLSFFELKRVIKEYKPDIIHAHDYRASIICSMLKTNQFFISHLHNNSPWIKKININSMIFLFACNRIDKILIVSNSIKNEYVFKNRIKNKIICIGNPVNRENILKKVENQKKFNYDICTIARISSQKNPFKFINIVSELKKEKKDIKAIWIGDGELIEDAKMEVKRQELEKNIQFVGFQENPYNYLNQSRVFLLTSDWEGYGLVAYEAIAMGLPSIVSKVGGLVDIIDENCGKLCTEIEEYTHEILLLLNNEKYYEKKSNEAVKKSISLENTKKYFSTLKMIYDC